MLLQCFTTLLTYVTAVFYFFTLLPNTRYLTYAEAAMEGTTAPLKARLGLSEDSESQDQVVRELTGCSRIVLSNWKVRILLQHFTTTIWFFTAVLTHCALESVTNSIFFWKKKSRLYAPCFFVAVDATRKHVVVVFRCVCVCMCACACACVYVCVCVCVLYIYMYTNMYTGGPCHSRTC